MDRRVKERLIGATILVALIVLIVPELLSGPKPAPLPPLAAGLPGSTRNVSVNLATSKATPEPQADAAASAGTPAPGAASSTSGAAPATSSSRPRSEEAESAQAGASATGGSGETGSGAAARAPAAGAIATLRAQPAAPLENSDSSPRSGVESARAAGSEALPGTPSRRAWAVQLGSFASKANAEKMLHQLSGSGFYLVSSGSGPSLRYRVRMGPLADRGAAERAVARLKAQGHAATIVTPAS